MWFFSLLVQGAIDPTEHLGNSFWRATAHKSALEKEATVKNVKSGRVGLLTGQRTSDAKMNIIPDTTNDFGFLCVWQSLLLLPTNFVLLPPF